MRKQNSPPPLAAISRGRAVHRDAREIRKGGRYGEGLQVDCRGQVRRHPRTSLLHARYDRGSAGSGGEDEGGCVTAAVSFQPSTISWFVTVAAVGVNG